MCKNKFACWILLLLLLDVFGNAGADIADYFNYGFTEDTWKLYCEKQRKMKGEVMQLNKIVVSTSHSFIWSTSFLWYSKSNNRLVRILVTLLSVLLFEVSVFNVLMFIDKLIVLTFFCMNLFPSVMPDMIYLVCLVCWHVTGLGEGRL